LIDEKAKDEEEWLIEKSQWQVEKQEYKEKISEMLEIAKNDKNAKLKEAEANEINQAYHKVIKDKETLENENALLRQEVKRLQMIISSPNEFDQIRSSMYGHEEDFGYSSHKNTLEKNRKNGSMSNASSQLSEGEFYSLTSSHNSSVHNSSTPSKNHTLERKIKSFFGFSTSRISEGNEGTSSLNLTLTVLTKFVHNY
jgi:hypothetical protein